MINFREAKESDLKKILEIEKRSFKDPWSFRIFKHLLNNPFCWFKVLEKDENIIGYIVAIDEGFAFHLINIAVEEKERRKGFGKFMIKKFIEEAKNRGIEYLYLEVRQSNLNAINLYKKFGFKIFDIKEKYYPDGEDAFLMELQLKWEKR